MAITIFGLMGDSAYKHKHVLQKIILHLTGWTRESFMTHYDDTIDSDMLDQIKEKHDLYAIHHEPLEYILGYVEYGGLRFAVNKNTIIPRPETEYMIEWVRQYMTVKQSDSPDEKSMILIDVGTGSGVLGLSILHSHGSQIRQAFLIDISEDALAVARENYQHCLIEWQIDDSIHVTIEKGNLLVSPSCTSGLLPSSQWPIVVVANLPYIPDETFDTNPDQSLHYEPRVAFVGGDDGLDLYRVMFNQIHNSQFTMHNVVMFLEMMTWQVDILKKEFEWLVFEEIKTFHFQIRIVKVNLKE